MTKSIAPSAHYGSAASLTCKATFPPPKPEDKSAVTGMEISADGGSGERRREADRKRGWMDGWHGGDFTFIPEMHVCDGRGIDHDMHREEGRLREAGRDRSSFS